MGGMDGMNAAQMLGSGGQIGIESDLDLEDSGSPEVIGMRKAGKVGAKKKKKMV